MKHTFALLLLLLPAVLAAASNETPETFGITTLTPPRLNTNPTPDYWARMRLWQGIPSIERAPGGRLWATWYSGGIGEGKDFNYQLLVTSDDDGRTWSKPVAVFDPSRQLLGGKGSDPHLWLDPSGKLWWFVHRIMSGAPGISPRTCWGFYTDTPDASLPRWRGPVFAGYGNSLNKGIVLADGRWLHMSDPLSRDDSPPSPLTRRGAHIYTFAGYDKPFERIGHTAINDTPLTEHMVVERRDGSLWMLARARTHIAQAVSTDGGRTWRELEPFTRDFGIGTRFHLQKLASGNLLLIANDHPRQRANMTAFLSEDDGKTWPHKLVLDARSRVSYPDATQSPDGFIYAIYDRGRYQLDEQEILMAKFTEADIKAGTLRTPGSRLSQAVNKLADEGGGVRRDGEATELHEQFQKSAAIPAAALLALPVQAQPADQPFLRPPQHAGPPQRVHVPTNRGFQGISSMAIAPGGRIWATWYAGETPAEDSNNYVVLATSGDKGKTWREILVIDPDGPGPVRAFDPEIWLTPDGRLFVFWAQAVGHNGTISGTWMMETKTPDAESPEWSAPRRLTDGIMMCKPLVLSSGEWVLPVSTWRKTDNSSRMVVSTDKGLTWTVRGACHVPQEERNYDEHMIVERRDGSLWMLVRTTYGIGESTSTDRGATWSELKPSSVAHTVSRFFIERLQSGNLLLVKHGPLDQSATRSHLTAYISTDDGRTWDGGLLLDEREKISYPDGQQAADGTIYITYDFDRTGTRHILFATFREEDVLARKNASGAVRLRQLVSEGSGGKPRPPKAPTPVALTQIPPRDNADGEPLRVRPATEGALRVAGADSDDLSNKKTLFADRKHTAHNIPPALNGARFLRVNLDGHKTLRCEQAATVYFLTPQPDRNRDSQTLEMEAQGFKKVALQEIPLFSASGPANCVTLYQKDCAAGEEITFGKWAVPIWFPYESAQNSPAPAGR